jgi:predicted RNA-binding Zn-ribbon protein involved in translation (DUF1610 family)
MESAGEAYVTDDEPPALAFFCPNCGERSSATSGG